MLTPTQILTILLVTPATCANLRASSSSCTTVSGSDANKPCQFPFVFKGTTYHSCTTDNDPDARAWCATGTYSNNEMIKGAWGHCHNTKCPIAAPASMSAAMPCSPQCGSFLLSWNGEVTTSVEALVPIVQEACKSDLKTNGIAGNGVPELQKLRRICKHLDVQSVATMPAPTASTPATMPAPTASTPATVPATNTPTTFHIPADSDKLKEAVAMWMDHRGKAMKQLGHITTWVIKGARVAEVQSMAEFLEWGVNGVSFFEDSNPQCRKWAKAGDCIQNEGFMTENCRRACNELTNPPTGFSPANGKQLKQAAALWIADLHAAEAKYGKVGKWAIRGSLGNKEVHHMGELLDVAVDQLKGCPSDQYYSSFLRRCVAMRR